MRAIVNLLRNKGCRAAGQNAYALYPDRILVAEFEDKGLPYFKGGWYNPAADVLTVVDVVFDPRMRGWKADPRMLQGVIAHEAGHRYLKLTPAQSKIHELGESRMRAAGYPMDTVYNLGFNCKGA